MNSFLLKATMVALLIASSLLPLVALAYEGPVAATDSPSRVAVLLAYIDPGAGGFIIVTVLGFISAVGYMARSYLARLKAMVFKGSASDRNSKAGEER